MDLALARRDREKLERSGHVVIYRIDYDWMLEWAFKTLGLPLITAETGVSYGGGRVSLYEQTWAMREDLKAAKGLISTLGADEILTETLRENYKQYRASQGVEP